MNHIHLVANLNLAVDRIIEIERLQPGMVHRAMTCRPRAGGKGMNAARALKALGHHSVVMGLLGGFTGKLIAQLAVEEAIDVTGVEMAGENRVCMILRDRSALEETVVNENGPEVPESVVADYLDRFRTEAKTAESVVLTGSLPPGVEPGFYGRIVETASESARRVYVDATGEALRQSSRAKPFLVKINNYEAADLFRSTVKTSEQARAACRQLLALGAQHAIVTLGSHGAIAIVNDMAWKISTPVFADAEAIGSGDAFMAAISVGFAEGRSVPETLKLGAATGSACAKVGITRISGKIIRQLLPEVEVNRIG